jgi:hypothetical protein
MGRVECLIVAMLLYGLFATSAGARKFDRSHKHYGSVLKLYVKDELVDYSGLKSNPKDLSLYLDETAAVSEADFKSWTQEQQLAFLINLYNAETLRLIIDHYPVRSIKDIASDSKGPWELPVVSLFGKKITLNHLEHGIIRKNYDEPRVHFALVCAALGCPPLRSDPYTAEKLNQQLEDQGKRFISDSTKNRVDLEKRIVYLSPIFQWFPEDFINKSGSVLVFVEAYFPDKISNELRKGNFKIEYTNYDWSLNDFSSKRS